MQVPATGRHNVTDILGQGRTEALGVLSFGSSGEGPRSTILAAAPGQVRMLTITKKLHGRQGMCAKERRLLIPSRTIHASMMTIPVAQVHHSTKPPSVPHKRVCRVLNDANLARLATEAEDVGSKPIEPIGAGHPRSCNSGEFTKTLREGRRT